MAKKYTVVLNHTERRSLLHLLSAGREATQRLAHARILLKADQGPRGSAWADERIAEALEVSIATVERVRRRFAENGLQAALDRKSPPGPSRRRKLDREGETRLLALASSPPPLGRTVWTLQLLADQLVELGIVDTISYETVRHVLKRR
jgi:transposase